MLFFYTHCVLKRGYRFCTCMYKDVCVDVRERGNFIIEET